MRSRAAVFWEQGRPLVRPRDRARRAGPGEVLVRMAAVGICGTDLHMVKGEWQRPTPMVLGHEGSGVVEAVGDGVESVAPGDEVVLSWAPSCGNCADCQRGRPGRVHVVAVRDRGRHAARRRDGHDARRRDSLSRHGDRCAIRAARRLGAGRAAAGRAAYPLRRRRCSGALRSRASARCSSPPAWSRAPPCSSSAPAALANSSSRGRGSRAPVRSSPSIPTRSGSSSCGASVRPSRPAGRSPALMKERLSGRRRLRVRRGRRSGDDEGRVPLDTERRALRHRRPACGGRPARARPHGVHQPRETADRDDLRLRGPGGRAARPAWTRSVGRARPPLAARPELLPRRRERRSGSRAGRRSGPRPRRALTWRSSTSSGSGWRGWTPTRAAASTSRTRFAGRSRPRPSLRRELGILDSWGDYPRKHAEADFHRVLRFEDEIDVRITPGAARAARRSRGASRSRGTASSASRAGWSSSTSTTTAGRLR